jgi:hypothetical protein
MTERPPEPTLEDRLEEPDSRSRRFTDLVARGYSVETSELLADAPVSLETITKLFEPDA